MPQWRPAAVPPPFRHDTSAYICTLTHSAYFTLLTFFNHTYLPPNTVWRNSAILSLAKISHDYFNGFSRRSMGFPINISQYSAIRKSKISHEVNEWENCSCFWLICCIKMSNLWIVWKHYIFLYFKTHECFTEESIRFIHTGWVRVNDIQPFIRFYLVIPMVRIV